MHGRDTRRQHGGNYNNYGYYNGNNNRTGQTRNHVIPNEPPYTAYIGNAPDTMVQGDFEHQLFVGLKVKQVRLVRDRQTDRFRGFAYVDFEDADSLRSAIALDGTCVNDRPIRIDVASRPLGGNKAEGFRNKPGFESRNGPRQPSGNSNNRSTGQFRPDGRNDQQHGVPRMIDGVYYENGYNDEYYNRQNSNEQTHSRKSNERQLQTQKEPTPPSSRKISDDVFFAPDTPVSNEEETNDNSTSMSRQKSRNWADCPIDDSVVESSPPPPPLSNTNNNTSTADETDDFQIVRNRTAKTRPNHQPSLRLMDHHSTRGRNGGGRNYYDQMSSSYSNQSQSQSYYHHHNNFQAPPPPLSSQHNNRSQPQPGGSRQRLNSNQSNNNREEQSNRDGKCLTSNTSNSSYEINPIPAENRPRLQLLPRSQKLSSSTDDNPTTEITARNSNIFGSGKPRDERDPKLMELSKHIEEVVEKEQHLSPTTPNESAIGVTNPIRILSSRSESSIDR